MIDGALQQQQQRPTELTGLGISAVPTFIFGRKVGVSGAHPPQALADAIRQSLT